MACDARRRLGEVPAAREAAPDCRGRKDATRKERYEKGEKQRKDCTMNTAKFREMKRHKVYPAIVEHYSG